MDPAPSLDPRSQVLLIDLISPKLVPQRQPPAAKSISTIPSLSPKPHSPRARIMLPAKDLDLAPAGTHALDHAVHLVRLAARLAHLAHDDVRVEPAVRPRGELEVPRRVRHRLHADEHVLLRVVEPVPRAPRADHALELGGKTRREISDEWEEWRGEGEKHLVRLHPDDLVHAGIAPHTETLPADLHRASGDPEEEQPLVLQRRYRHRAHLVVRHRAIRELCQIVEKVILRHATGTPPSSRLYVCLLTHRARSDAQCVEAKGEQCSIAGNHGTYAHMNVPRRIGHDDMKLAKNRIVEPAQVTVDPLRWELPNTA